MAVAALHPVKLHPAERAEFVAGMLGASEIVAGFEHLSPQTMRAAANGLDETAHSAYQSGLAQGLRVIASEVEDGAPLGVA